MKTISATKNDDEDDKTIETPQLARDDSLESLEDVTDMSQLASARG